MTMDGGQIHDDPDGLHGIVLPCHWLSRVLAHCCVAYASDGLSIMLRRLSKHVTSYNN